MALLDRLLALQPLIGRYFPSLSLYIKSLFIRSTIAHPHQPFARQTPPPEPDYHLPACWAAFPGLSSKAEVQVGTEPVVPEADRRADVFYIHPTAFFGSDWNAPYDEPAASAQVDELMIGSQASVFNHQCRVYAPRYRQMQFVGFSQDPEQARAACDVAYNDIHRAFLHFLECIGDRPFFIASHSQGSLHAARLLEMAVEQHSCVQRCVAAYVIGMGIPREKFDGPNAVFSTLHPSSGPKDTQAVISWNLRAFQTEGECDFLNGSYGPGYFSAEGCRGDLTAGLLQTNPLTWSSTVGNRSVGAAHYGFALSEYDPPYNPVDAQSGKPMLSKLFGITCKQPREETSCTVSKHEVVVHGLSRALSHKFLGTGVGDLHIFDYSYFYFNLRENISLRLDHFLHCHGGATTATSSKL